MILIADSGSTKTDWCVSDGGKQVQRLTTKGINPVFQSADEIGTEVALSLLPSLKFHNFDALHFYGAGCIPEKIQMMEEILSRHIPASTVTVSSDMLGAAHGLSGKTPGIVCILGTGSNSCFYDGSAIVSNISPLGFILGDEGSGAVLGKLLVSDILKNQLPAGLKEKFLRQFDLTPALITEKVYRQPFPNRFLASLSPFLFQNISEPSLRLLVLNSFKSFLQRNVKQYDCMNYRIHFVGSIAHHYREILSEAVHESGMNLGQISQSPMEGLVDYWKECS